MQTHFIVKLTFNNLLDNNLALNHALSHLHKTRPMCTASKNFKSHFGRYVTHINTTTLNKTDAEVGVGWAWKVGWVMWWRGVGWMSKRKWCSKEVRMNGGVWWKSEVVREWCENIREDM